MSDRLFGEKLLLWGKYEEKIEIKTASEKSLKSALPIDKEITVLSWNVGYCGLSEDADFFMDGGSGVYAKDEATVLNNMENIESIIAVQNPDIIMLQLLPITSRFGGCHTRFRHMVILRRVFLL